MIKSIQKFFTKKRNLYILLDDHEGVGYRGEVLKIKYSVAQGILLPQKRAVYYTKGRYERLFNSEDISRLKELKKNDKEQKYLKKIQKPIKINEKENKLNDVYLKKSLKSFLKRKKNI